MTAPLGLLEKTSAYLQYLVDRGTHWFPRVNFLIGRIPSAAAQPSR